MRLFDAAATRQPLQPAALVAALRSAFAEGITVPPRHVHTLGQGDQAGTVLIMPAWDAQGFFGIKTVNVWPGNSARGLPGLHATYTLYDASTGAPLALMDGNEITAARTACASALAAGWLARADAAELLVLGSGRVAQWLPAAHATQRPIRRVRVWNHRAEGARRLAAQWHAEGWSDVQAIAPDLDALAAAVRQADIVSCATLSTAPLVRGAWLAPGSHLDLIGSFTPAMRECDGAALAGAQVWADTPEALAKAGDLLQAIAEGAWQADALVGTLAQLARGACAGRRDAQARTVFKSVGTALEDLAAARLVWRAAIPKM